MVVILFVGISISVLCTLNELYGFFSTNIIGALHLAPFVKLFTCFQLLLQESFFQLDDQIFVENIQVSVCCRAIKYKKHPVI